MDRRARTVLTRGKMSFSCAHWTSASLPFFAPARWRSWLRLRALGVASFKHLLRQRRAPHLRTYHATRYRYQGGGAFCRLSAGWLCGALAAA